MQLTDTEPILRQIAPLTYLFFRTETTISRLEDFLPVGQELIREAEAFQLKVEGPVEWHYFDFTGEPEKSFILEIAIPVSHAMTDYDGSFHFKRPDNFDCVSMIHEGDWMQIPNTYARLISFLEGSGKRPSGINREVYIQADFVHPQNNVTEIQMGIL